MEGVTRLNWGEKEILLVATAHVSQESVELVRRVAEDEAPDSICIELDEKRYERMENPQGWDNTDVVKVVKSGQAGYLLANLAISSYQKKIAKKLGTAVGQEMVQGIASAKEAKAELVLADRSIQTTFLRIWRKLSLWEKGKLIFSLVFSLGEDEEVTQEDIRKLLQKDLLESVLADMRKEFPKIGDILIGERDKHLAAKIKGAPGKKVMAVLGGAHVPGVTKEIFLEQDLSELETVPPKGKGGKVVGWLIPLLILGLMAYGFWMSPQTGLRQLGSWVLWNGGLAALCTALCLGHPLTVLTAFVAAPISSLNPLMACGWFAGLTEAAVRKPTVADVNNIPSDIFSIKGFLKNRFLRVLLIVILANLGSTAGTLIAGLDMVKALF